MSKKLLAKLEELGDVDQNEQIKACGYYLIKGNGQEKLLLSAFYASQIRSTNIILSE